MLVFNKNQDFALCLLVRNEEACLKILLPKITEFLKDIRFTKVFAIDGGSIDQTVALLKAFQIPVIAQSQRGRGQAFHEAFANVDAEAIIFFSPDGNEDITDLPKFVNYLREGYDLVIASRMSSGAENEEDHQIFRWRKWANKAFTFLANLLFRRTGDYLTDAINGYRALTVDGYKKLNLTAVDYTIEYQMTIRAFKKNLKIKEFPTIEGQRIAGRTGAPSLPTGLRFLKRLIAEF